MTYVMYNFDLGYVQGMSDLLSPILYVMKNEVDAFWCFVGFMDRVASNFEFDQGIVDTEIILLGNKIDMINEKKVSDEAAEKLARERKIPYF